jgi:hypothetical protein
MEEAADMKARVKVQNSLGDAQDYARGRDSYGGVYVDQQRGGLPVFLFTGDADRHKDDIAARLPKGVDFATRSVDRTWDELVETLDRMIAEQGALGRDGIHLAGASVDTRGNRVVAKVVDPTDRDEAVIRERYGAEVVVRAGRPAHADACNTRYDCWPMMAGVNIVPTNFADGFCTAGFLARRTDTDQIVVSTAGHCLWGAGEYEDAVVFKHHGNNFGVGRERVYQNNKPADIGIINMYSSVSNDFEPPASEPSIHRFLSDDTPPVIQYMPNTVTGENQNQGFIVCRFGRTSARDCGTITSGLTSNESVATNRFGSTQTRMITKTLEVDFDSQAGDSGGPIFSDLTENVGYGLHIHSLDPEDEIGWYVPLNWARKTLIDERGVTINWCLTSTC